MNKSTHIMAKPTSHICNIACDYCFYLQKGETTLSNCSNLMTEKTLEAYIKNYIEQTPSNTVEFTWQGGEPTLAGLEFFKKVIELQNQYSVNKVIRNSLQTNGLIINKNWAMFLKEHNFLVGLSCDGPEHIHDRYRKNKSGSSGTHKQVIESINTLKQYDVAFNILCVVTDYSCKYGKEIYRYFVEDLRVNHLQFIPIVEHKHVVTGELIYPTPKALSELTNWSVPSKCYGEFLKDVFNSWIERDVGTVFVQIFDSTLAAWVGDMPSMCVMQPSCGDSLIMESNGDIYNCDHFVYPEYRIGSIFNIETCLELNEKRIAFSKLKPNVGEKCKKCPYKFACQGGCPKHRVPIGNEQHNLLCDGYKEFFRHVAPYMDFMASLIKRKYSPSLIMNYLTHLLQLHDH